VEGNGEVRFVVFPSFVVCLSSSSFFPPSFMFRGNDPQTDTFPAILF
jgi:hypothetical protein